MVLQITPQMTILVAVEPADFRKGIDGLARLCQEALQQVSENMRNYVLGDRKCYESELDR